MSSDSKIILGIVKDGVVVPPSENQLPDGAQLEIALQPAGMANPHEPADERDLKRRHWEGLLEGPTMSSTTACHEVRLSQARWFATSVDDADYQLIVVDSQAG